MKKLIKLIKEGKINIGEILKNPLILKSYKWEDVEAYGKEVLERTQKTEKELEETLTEAWEKYGNEYFLIPIEELGLNESVIRLLKSEGIKNVSELASLTEDDLRNVVYLSEKTIDLIKEKLKEMGLELGEGKEFDVEKMNPYRINIKFEELLHNKDEERATKLLPYIDKPDLLVNYAINFNTKLPPEQEQIVAKNPYASLAYALKVLKDRFILGEPSIVKMYDEMRRKMPQKGEENLMATIQALIHEYFIMLNSVGKLEDFMKDYRNLFH